MMSVKGITSCSYTFFPIGEKYIDYGFTVGLGLEYLANTQTFDIALRIGNRESYILQDHYERYISLHFGITTGEKWFMKRNCNSTVLRIQTEFFHFVETVFAWKYCVSHCENYVCL